MVPYRWGSSTNGFFGNLMVSDWDYFPQPETLSRESLRPNPNTAPRKAVIMFFVVYQI
jgi:hypothetical protein